MILCRKSVEVERASLLEIWWVGIYKSIVLACKLGNHIFAVLSSRDDTVGVKCQNSHSLCKTVAVEPSIDFIVSGLLQSTDWTAVEDARTISSVQEKCSETQFFSIACVDGSIYLALLTPFVHV